MRQSLRVKKGYDFRLTGELPAGTKGEWVSPGRIAIYPDDYPGLTPKPTVKEGECITAGQALYHDKNFAEISVVSPVSGTVERIERGSRRKIERIIVTVTKTGPDSRIEAGKDGNFKSRLLASGLWALIHQRPYDIVARPDRGPRDIFVTAFDSSPLAPENSADATDEATLTAAVAALKTLTTGRIYISRRPGSVADISGAEMVDVTGPHPAGNVGVQASLLAPVNKGETIWTLDIATLAKIGQMELTGSYTATTEVALVGPGVAKPALLHTIDGAEIAPLIAGRLRKGETWRLISGNPLTGTVEDETGYLHYPWRQLTVIADGGNRSEFMGWASLNPKKMSVNRSFPGRLFRRSYSPDARLLGGHRAMILSGVYDKVFPQDILPEYLIKAIIGRDIEKMENLGIYEVAPEDFALAEALDPSKIGLQKIVADGLDYLRKELD